jgi:uncharacterized membrane protein
MNKILLTTFLAIFFVLALTTVKADLQITGKTTSLEVFQNSNEQGYFNIKNNGTDNLTNIIFSNSALPSGATLSFSINNINLSVNETKRVDFTVSAESDAETGTDTITISANSNSMSTSFTFDLTIEQSYCEEGPQGSDVEIREVSEPDKNDDFYAGENISVSLTVRTHDDIDIVIDAELFDTTTQETIDDAEVTDTLDDDTQDYDLDLKVSSDVDTSDEYVVRIKAYEDGNEDEQCKEKIIPVTIKKRSHELVIEKISIENPGCGDSLGLSVKVENAGKNDEDDTIVSVFNTALGLDLEQTKDINEGDSETFYFNDLLPIVSPGKYELEISASSDSADDYETITINLQDNCRVQKKDVSISVKPTSYYVNQENTATITLTNTGTSAETYNLDVSNLNWASLIGIQTTPITLNQGESQDIYITFQPNANASSINTFRVTVSFEGQTKTQDVQVQLQTSKPSTGSQSLSEQIKNALQKDAWLFILNIILIIIIVVLIIIVATRRPRQSRQVIATEPREARLKGNKKGKKK